MEEADSNQMVGHTDRWTHVLRAHDRAFDLIREVRRFSVKRIREVTGDVWRMHGNC